MCVTPLERVERLLRIWHVEGDAEALLRRAADIVEAGVGARATGDDAWQGIIVTKGPHAGSQNSVVEIVARVLAHGDRVVAVEHRSPDEAESLAKALYPDIGDRYTSVRFTTATWASVDALFDRPEFPAIVGEPYSRDLVLAARDAMQDSGLTTPEFARVWATGRRPLSPLEAEERYGADAARVLCPAGEPYDWYRGPLPVGIQKVESATMAFALKHPQVRQGRPTIVVNGQFTLLSQSFGNDGAGTTVITVELSGEDAFRPFRRDVIGHSDVPSECLEGSIRRDAVDGFFGSDSPKPVTPWANVVHGSDGYLSGLIETVRLSHYSRASLLERLHGMGYGEQELRDLILADPAIEQHGGRLRLTHLTKQQDLSSCVATVLNLLPPAGAPIPDRDLLAPFVSTLYRSAVEGAPLDLEGTVPAPGARRPDPAEVIDHNTIPAPPAPSTDADLSVGVLVPLAGSGGRFAGYDVAEGSAARMKALLPVFTWDGEPVSALDVRVRFSLDSLRSMGAQCRFFLSCNHASEERVRQWAQRNPDLAVEIGRVPEALRFSDPTGTDWPAPLQDRVLRDTNGTPLTKPIGSFGLIWAAHSRGTLERWRADGVTVVALANADDVGFVVDPAVVGMFSAQPDLDAVVMVVETDGVALPSKGGLLRQRLGRRGWSSYVQENAAPADAGEYFSTNQMYLRLSSLIDALETRAVHELPVYLERKSVSVGDQDLKALHAYRPYCEVLRALPVVRAVRISRLPGERQRGGYRPLKKQADVPAAQAMLDQIRRVGASHA